MSNQPMYSREAEEALVGAVLIDPEIFGSLNLSASQFYLVKNQFVWQAISRIRAAKQNVDIVTVRADLEKNGHLEEIGGVAYLMTCVNQTPSSLNAPSYAEVVRDYARRRFVLQTINELAREAVEMRPLEEAIASATTKLVSQVTSDGGAEPLMVYASRLFDDVQQRASDPREIYGIATGMQDIDAITRGMQPGEEIMLSGEPGLGKSLLAFQWAWGMAQSAPGAVYSMEMGGLQVVRRQAANLSKIETYKLRGGTITPEEWESFVAAIEKMSQSRIYLSDRSTWTTVSLRADLARLKERYGIQWFVLDYVRLLKDSYGKSEHERSAEISNRVHDICKDLELAGIVINSMNKVGMGAEEPGKEHLTGSGQFGYDADQIVFMTKDKKKREPGVEVVNLTWDKNREGDSSRVVKLLKVRGFPAFVELAKENY